MKRTIFAAAVLGGALLLAGCSYGTQSPSSSNSGVPAPSGQVQSQPGSVQSQPAANTVVIQNFAFNPATLTIKKGETVTWLNHDSVTHTVKSSAFNSGDIPTAGQFQFTFSSPGTYAYSCGIHPSMQGTVIVQ
jgi:plastocyanin